MKTLPMRFWIMLTLKTLRKIRRSVAWLRSGERGKRGETISPRFCITKPRVRCSFRLCYNGYPELTVSLLACIRRGDDFLLNTLVSGARFVYIIGNIVRDDMIGGLSRMLIKHWGVITLESLENLQLYIFYKIQ